MSTDRDDYYGEPAVIQCAERLPSGELCLRNLVLYPCAECRVRLDSGQIIAALDTSQPELITSYGEQQ